MLLEANPVFFPCSSAQGVSILFVTVFRVLAAAAFFDLQEVQIQRSAGARGACAHHALC